MRSLLKVLAATLLYAGFLDATPPARAGLINDVSGAMRAYSLRRLDDDYTGAAIEVRRGSDDTTQDIGFDANGNLDIVAMLGFVGVGDGYVVTWYDQTTAGAVDVSDTTHSDQPRIVSGGVLVTAANGEAAVEFSGGQVLHAAHGVPMLAKNTAFTVAQFTSLPSNNWGLDMRLWTLAANNATRLASGGDAVGSEPRLACAYGTPFACKRSSHVLDTSSVLVTTIVADATRAAGSDTIELFADAQSVLELTNVSISQDDDFLAIGGYDTNGDNFGLHGYLQEVIFYGDIDTADRQQVEAELMKAYDIPEPSSFVLVLMGLIGMARRRTRRRTEA